MEIGIDETNTIGIDENNTLQLTFLSSMKMAASFGLKKHIPYTRFDEKYDRLK